MRKERRDNIYFTVKSSEKRFTSHRSDIPCMESGSQCRQDWEKRVVGINCGNCPGAGINRKLMNKNMKYRFVFLNPVLKILCLTIFIFQ